MPAATAPTGPSAHAAPAGTEQRRAFAARVRGLRRRRGITQAEAARLAGVAPSTWGAWEEGRRLPRLSALPAIAAALRVSTTALLRSRAGADTGPEKLRRPRNDV